eukprot:Pgem_evm1s2590
MYERFWPFSSFIPANCFESITFTIHADFCKEEERLRENQIPDLSNSCYSNDICNSKAVSYPSSCPDPKEDIQVVETELVEIKSSNTNDDIENGVVNDLNKNNVNNDSCNDNRNGDVI